VAISGDLAKLSSVALRWAPQRAGQFAQGIGGI